MRIASLDIRACRHPEIALGGSVLRDGQGRAGLDYLVYTVTTDCGREASMFGFAGRSALGAGHLAAASLRPFFVGRPVLDREAAWHDWRTADRWWHHLPIYSYGPVDCCLWILGAEAAGQPLWRYIGGAREEVPVYASSLVLPGADAYAAEARAVKAAGLKADRQDRFECVRPEGAGAVRRAQLQTDLRAVVGPRWRCTGHQPRHQCPRQGTCKTVLRQRAARIELRETHGDTAANGRTAVKPCPGAQIETLTPARLPGEHLRAM